MADLSPDDKALIYHLSGDLGDSPAPYAALAAKLGRTEEEVLEAVARFQAEGLIRRLGATLWHQKSGYSANAMVVFKLPEEKADEGGVRLAGLPYVSHCYRRVTVPEWPYSLYAMIHAESRRELLAMVEEMAALTGAEQWRMLESLRELKKASRRYFSEIMDQPQSC
jgi:Transcriptional regulators